MHEGAIVAGEGGEGVVRHDAHVGQVSDDWPWLWAGREGKVVAAATSGKLEEIKEEDSKENGGENER